MLNCDPTRIVDHGEVIDDIDHDVLIRYASLSKAIMNITKAINS